MGSRPNPLIVLGLLCAVALASGCGGGGRDEGGKHESAVPRPVETVAPINPTQGAPPSPNRYGSPFLNARPDAAYVGDAVCASCHAEIAATYRKHGMANSFLTADKARFLGDWSGRETLRHEASGYAYTMLEREGRRFVVETREAAGGLPPHRVEKEVGAAIGSGANDQGYAYEEAGGWYILPVEWYTEAGTWGMAPGFDGEKQERWKRRLMPGCLGCHASAPDYIADSANRYRPPMPEGIGCERCHGPGAPHAQARRLAPADTSGGAFDSTIVNPARLSPARQIDVCSQCHLQGDVRRPRPGTGEFDFRPGLRFADFKETYVPASEDTLVFGFVRQVERMARSRCYTESGTMTCTTCHDPHVSSHGQTREHWAERCMGCHAPADCPATGETREGTRGSGTPVGSGRTDGLNSRAEHAEPHGATQRAGRTPDCVGCHMRRSQPYDLAHVAVTDHWIRRRIEPPQVFERTRTRARDDIPIVRFAIDAGAPDTGGAALASLGVALVAIGHDSEGLPLLERGIALGPPRSEAQLQRAIALNNAGRRDEALSALDAAARLGPESVESAFRMGTTFVAAGRPALAVSAFRAGIAGYPEDADAWVGLSIALSQCDSVAAARSAARWATQIHPGSPDAQRVLGLAELAAGDTAAAEVAFLSTLALSPDDREAWVGLGHALAARGDTSGAGAAWREAARLGPGGADLFAATAREAIAGGRLDAAIVAAQVATERTPGSAASWLLLGDALGRASRYREAIDAFDRAGRIDPRSVAALGNRALAHTELGETRRARAIADTLRALDPANPKIKALLARIEQIESAGLRGR